MVMYDILFSLKNKTKEEKSNPLNKTWRKEKITNQGYIQRDD